MQQVSVMTFSYIIYINSVYKNKAIYSSVNKGSYINSISILSYYI